jgi:hypothetical protein
MTQYRVGFLREFDKYIRNEIGDEDIIEYWITAGVPDGFDEADLLDIAKDNEAWLDCVQAFSACCRMAGILES